jgi:hypothetical protein
VTEEVPKESEKQEFGNEDGDWQVQAGLVRKKKKLDIGLS